MIKNVIVVDEQGNEYGATYPKRAKGLVKNGRARFIEENKICHACPPDIFWEDNQMENNINNNLSAKEIFDQIVKLQNQLTENSQTSLHRLGDVITDVRGENYENNDDIASQINAVCTVFSQREETLKSMLDLYRKMYEDYRNDKCRREERVKDLFENMAEDFARSDFSDSSQFDEYPEIAEKFFQVVDILYRE